MEIFYPSLIWIFAAIVIGIYRYNKEIEQYNEKYPEIVYEQSIEEEFENTKIILD